MNSVSVNRYLMAPAIGAFAVAAWMALHQLTPMGEHTTLLQLAIVASALGWGWQAGLATMLTAGLGLVLFILPPEGSFSIADRGDMVAVPVYFAVGSVLVALAATSRSLRERARLHQAAAEEREHAISTECAARALAEEHLRHSEERYRTLLELCPDAVYVCASGRLVYANAALARLLGEPAPDALTGRPIRDFLSPRESARNSEECCNPISGPREEVWQRPGGAEIECESSSARVPWCGQSAVQVVLRDISARKALERALRAHEQALERSNTDLADFAQLVSHDLKEPLRGIASTADALLADYGGSMPPGARDLAETLARLPRRLGDMIGALLAYARIVHSEHAAAPTDLKPLIEGVLDRLRVWIDGEGGVVEVESDLPRVECAPSHISELFANLISNAVKYNTSRPRRVWVGVQGGRAGPTFYVRDNGIGIPPGKREAIFAMFRRLHGRDAYGGGCGAGLAMVRKIVERHGGRIWVESEPGLGSTFYFTLQPGIADPRVGPTCGAARPREVSLGRLQDPSGNQVAGLPATAGAATDGAR